jgi:phosphatidate phosphatase APP1
MKLARIAVLVSLLFALDQARADIVVKTLVISDVDDTVKVTNVLNKPMKIFNSLFSKKAFSGMPELYQELFAEETAVYYLSASPDYIMKTIRKFLDKNNFPQIHQIILKKSKVDTFTYKRDAIRNLLKRVKPTRVILIGDDTQVDPEVYNLIADEHPGIIDAIYIRSVKNRKLPTNPLMQSFFSPVEIAGFEYLKNNLSAKSLKIVANGFLDQDNNSKLFIKKRYCPEEGRVELEEIKQRLTEATLISLVEKSQKKIEKACR